MVYTPQVLRSPDGHECLVGTPAEREQLLCRGYVVVEKKVAATPKSDKAAS